MARRTIDALNTLTAGILILTGQSLLLVPRAMEQIFRFPRPETEFFSGLLFSLLGWMTLSLTVNPYGTWRSRLVQGMSALLLGWLSYAYFESAHLVEAALVGGIAIPMAGLVFIKEKKHHPKWDHLIGFAIAINLATGILLLGWDKIIATEWNGYFSEWRLASGGLFVSAALAAPLLLQLGGWKWKRAGSILSAVPWLGWSAANLAGHSLSGLIPAATLAFLLFSVDAIPWPRVKLPKDDLLGRRLILFAILMQIAFLSTVSSLLNAIESLQGFNPIVTGFLLSSGRNAIYLANLVAEALVGFAMLSIVIAINELAVSRNNRPAVPPASSEEDPVNEKWNERIAHLIQPFASTQLDDKKMLDMQNHQIAMLDAQVIEERRRSAQLILLSELSQQLETQLDIPVAAQLAMNTLYRSLDCSAAALYLTDPERRELVALAAAGLRSHTLPPGYRQSTKTGALGRAIRLRKPQIIADSRRDPDFIQLEGAATLSCIVIPLIDHGHVKGALEVNDARPNAFSSQDIRFVELIAAELLRAWERSEYHQRLTELIRAGISLTTQPDPQAAVQEVASIARQTLRARFTFVTLLDQDGNFTRTAISGNAPRLLKTIGRGPADEPLLQAALNANEPFRIRDVRKYKHASHIDIDFSGLRSLIAIPIRLHRLSIGAILAFGKQGEVFFTVNDESLASLLSSQASAAIESAWLSQELRNTLATTTQLYQLSFHIIQAGQLTDALRYIAETAQRVCDAAAVGIVLFSPEKKVEAEVQLDAKGAVTDAKHPADLIQRAMETGQSIFHSTEDEMSRVCFPLKTSQRTFGALWLHIPNNRGQRFAANLQTLVNQAAVALERSILLIESREQAKQIEDAYRELETTYDRTLAALMSALDARDRETEGHSIRVSQVARLMGEKLHLSSHELKALERGSLLHDIGKIGVSDNILHKPGPLDENEWKIMRQHPTIGAYIVKGIPFLEETLPVVEYHQERWDGSGYPVGMSGKDIPFLARIFAVADAFDALTSNRPYRQKISSAEAIQYLQEQAGILFDPEIVKTIVELSSGGALDLEDTPLT
jgi:putative nucleotidyltransferase with HDIG domain